MYRIFIIEDDNKIARLIGQNLEKYNYNYKITEDFEKIIPQIIKFKPHLILLDINLPKYDGFYWCEEIRKITKIPIIFISSRDSNMDMIMALNMGGDDFVQKPFSMDFLITKIKSNLRRTYSYTDSELSLIEKNGVILDFKKRILLHKNNEIELTNNEFNIMTILFENYEETVGREKIIKKLWDDENFVDDNTLTVNINRLRKKLERYDLKNYIKTIKGEGYKIS